MKRKKLPHPLPIEKLDFPVIIFITLCVSQRRPILACPEAHHIITAAWKNAESWFVGRYMIMPDHLHFFCAPGRDSKSLERWIQFWKSSTTKSFGSHISPPFWQRDFWDSQVRGATSYNAKWDYVIQNPVRAGLVASPEEWPFQGVLHDLDPRW